MEGMRTLQVDTAPVQIHQHVLTRGLGDGRRVSVGEQPGGVRTLASVVEDVKLDGDAVTDPASRAGIIRAIAEAATTGTQGGWTDALDGEGEAVGHRIRAWADLEGEVGGEGSDTHAFADESAAGLPGATIGEPSHVHDEARAAIRGEVGGVTEPFGVIDHG